MLNRHSFSTWDAQVCLWWTKNSLEAPYSPSLALSNHRLEWSWWISLQAFLPPPRSDSLAWSCLSNYNKTLLWKCSAFSVFLAPLQCLCGKRRPEQTHRILVSSLLLEYSVFYAGIEFGNCSSSFQITLHVLKGFRKERIYTPKTTTWNWVWDCPSTSRAKKRMSHDCGWMALGSNSSLTRQRRAFCPPFCHLYEGTCPDDHEPPGKPKNPPANARDMDSIPWSERSPGEGNGYSSIFPGESLGQRSLAGYSSWGLKELDTMTDSECMHVRTCPDWRRVCDAHQCGVSL